MVAHHLAKVRAAGSTPVIRSNLYTSGGGDPKSVWLSGLGAGLQNQLHEFESRHRLRSDSSEEEHHADSMEVTGSTPVPDTQAPPSQRGAKGSV